MHKVIEQQTAKPLKKRSQDLFEAMDIFGDTMCVSIYTRKCVLFGQKVGVLLWI